MTTYQITQADIAIRVRKLVKASNDDMVLAAQACRASNFTAQQCLPELHVLFPNATADKMAAVAVEVWGASLASGDLSGILKGCGYPDTEVALAVAANMSLKYLNVAHVPTQYGGDTNMQLKMIGLSQGNLVTLKQAERARFLVFSCLPGDYSPTAGTVIKALHDAYDLNIATMAADPAADYRSTHHCWISKDLSTYTSKTVPYQQVICFESSGAAAPDNISGIFTAIKTYVPNPPKIPNTGATIMTAMVSTGGAGGDKSAVLTALFNGCWGLMNDGNESGTGYNLTNFRIVVYNMAWDQAMTQLFEQLKQQHT